VRRPEQLRARAARTQGHARVSLSRAAVVFNIANKKCLNSWNHPWALATTHLAVGTACMLPLWLPLPRRGANGAREWRSLRPAPSLTRADLGALLPVTLLLATGHVTSTLAPAYGTVAFSNIIKTAEPLFTCAFSVLLMRRAFKPSVYASLLLVVLGVGLVSTREVNFSSFSLAAGMLSNAAFALYSIGAKRLLRTRDAKQTYALLTMTSCAVLAPVALVAEGSGIGSSRLAAAHLAPAHTGWRLAALLGFTGLVQYLSNEVAFCTLSMIHPVTYALANTFKRSIVVVASLLVFRQHLPPAGAVGAAMALLGALGYSISMASERAEAAKAA
jgi:solute carrier family 35 protein E1